MGLGNKLIVSASGFPGTNKTLRFIQDAFREPLESLAKLAGEKTILTGVVNTGGTVSQGFITYNGEIIPFQAGPYASTVTIIESIENVAYNTDANDDTILDSLPAYRTIYARCGTGGSVIFPYSDLSRLKTVKELSNFTLPANIVTDSNYVHTDANFTLALLNKLNGIQAGAEVNVQADWTMTSPTSDAYIKNKPFNDLQFTSGMLVTSNSSGGYKMFNYGYNFAYVYPPSGYSIYDYVACIPSIAEINFSGDVDGNDSFWCTHQVQYSNGRIVVICNNSEYRNRALVNFLAIWRK